jgi:TIGR03009 family protein
MVMRYSWLALAGLLAWNATGSAQQPTQTQPVQIPATPPSGQAPPGQAQPAFPQTQPGISPQGQPGAPPATQPLDPEHNPLDKFLLRWEQEMKNVETLSAQLSRIEENKTFQTVDVYVGIARYMKPNLASLEMQKKDKPDLFEKFVCNGQMLYQYKAAQKEIWAHQLPAPKPGQVSDDNFLSFLFGMKAEEAKRRYDIKVAKEDQWYVYLDVLPRFDADKADFQRARLVLTKDTFMPRQLWFEQPNRDTVTWDIPKIETKVPLKRDEFLAPPVPQGWTMKQVPRTTDMPPRVIRQKDDGGK